MLAPRRIAVAFVAVAGAAGVGGCGRSGDRATVRATTERFLSAYADARAGVACAALDEDARSELESQEGTSCSRALPSVRLRSGSIVRVQVSLTNAKVDLSSGESEFLSEGSSGWRLSAIGCRPQGGKPADRPFDCELEA